MPDLTPKQEAFALAYVECGNATEAYRRAYDVDPSNLRDSWLHVEACQLLDNPKVAIRVKELQEQAAKLSLYTIKQAVDEYDEARRLALSLEKPAAAVQAIAGKVKLFGLDQATKLKAELTGKDGGPIETKDASGAEKLAEFLNGIAERSAKAGDAGA